MQAQLETSPQAGSRYHREGRHPSPIRRLNVHRRHSIFRCPHCANPQSYFHIIMRTLPFRSVPQPESLRSTLSKPRRGPAEPPPPPRQFQSMRNVINCHPSGGNSRRCPPPPPLDPGAEREPLLPDQPPFSARRRFIATRGGITINPPGVFSARHPSCINGNESFKFGHRVATCPDFPQEKQTTSLQSRQAGRCRCDGCCRWRCSERNERIICSNSVGAGGLITGGGWLCFSVTSRCNSFYRAGTSGVRAGDYTGVRSRRSISSS